MYYYGAMYTPNELYHFGVKGMKWGVRRYQNKDGSLTSAGQRHRDQSEGGSKASANARKANRKKKIKRALGITLGTAAAAGLAYGGYRLKKMGPTGRALLRAKGDLALKSLQSKAADKKVDILERGGLKGIARTKASNAGTRARNLYNQSRNFAKSGVGKAKTAYGNASDAVGRKLVKMYSSDAYGKVAKAKYNVGQAAGKVGRKVSGAASSAYSNAWKYGRKAASATGNAAKSASLRARTAGYEALGKYYDYQTNRRRKKTASKIRYKGF